MRARRCGGSSRTGGVTSVTTTLGPASRCCHPSGRTATRRRPGSVTRPYGSPGQGRDHTPAGLARRCHTPCPAALLRLPALSGRHGPDRDPGHARSCLDRHDHELRARPRNPHRGCLDQRAATRRRSSEGALLVNTDLPAALRTHAHGRPACEAAVELMLAGRRWLRRGDYVDGFIRSYPGTAAGAGLVAIDWAAAIGAAQTGQPPPSGWRTTDLAAVREPGRGDPGRPAGDEHRLGPDEPRAGRGGGAACRWAPPHTGKAGHAVKWNLRLAAANRRFHVT